MQDLRLPIILKYGVIVILNMLLIHSSAADTALNPTKPFIIVIDAGHGGKDIGTAGSHLIEKDATLLLSLELGEKMNKLNPNIKVEYTRQSDQFLPIHSRIAKANAQNADLFISIHCNAVKEHAPHGIETYVLGTQNNTENLETVKRENKAILHEENYSLHYDGFDPHSTTGHIYLSAVQNQFINEGILIAHQVQTQFSDQNIMRNRGVKQAGFVVLKKATMPAILLEVGFLSNKKDEQKLINNQTRQLIISKIADGINNYILQIRPGRHQLIAQNSEMGMLKTNSERDGYLSRKTISTPQKKPNYHVVLASSVNEKLKNFQHLIIDNIAVKEIHKNGTFFYVIGQYDNLIDAIIGQNKMRKVGYNGAYAAKAISHIEKQAQNKDIEIKYVGVN